MFCPRSAKARFLLAIAAFSLFLASERLFADEPPRFHRFDAHMISPEILLVQGIIEDSDGPVTNLSVRVGGLVQEELLVMDETGFFAREYYFDNPPVGIVTGVIVDENGNQLSGCVVEDVY